MDPFGGGDSDLFDIFAEGGKPTLRARRAPESAEPSAKRVKRTPAEDGERKDAKSSAASSSSSSAQSTSTAGTAADGEQKAKSVQKAMKKKKTMEEEEEGDYSFAEFAEQAVEPVEVTGARCSAEVCYPPKWDFEKAKADAKARVPKAKPAKEYPFVLDAFQRESVRCIENNQSVLVSAHTSAGKTVVAEYAIATALRDGQRVIYTSPIKALSNQKYRELYDEFQDVGLMTGDITINPSASALVMTTEILRNMLYRGSEIMREVAWVIFDEIHYMRDKERGVVWEETLILLPDRVRFVFLSATIPNAREFALWVAKLHKQPCSVVYTDFRPTPLQHYLFPVGAEGLYLVVDDKGVFREDNFAKAMACLGNAEGAPGAEGGGEGKDGKGKKKKKQAKQGAGTDIYKIVRMIMERHYEPVIIFSFSKRECEEHALHMSKLDFSDDEEKKLIEQIFMNAIDSLSEDDKHLPQVENILPLLKRGIGIHHGGLLPILKEVIEILFQEGLLKALFSTETFSMGLNMPAKTVVFTSVRKFDGEDFRVVSSGEYIQMSGRAGRRGLDDKGIVICMLDEQLQHEVARDMIKGASDPLNSSFHLGYNMLLNLLRVEEADPEYMMARSFRQFQMNRQAPKMQEKLEAIETEKAAITIKDPQGLAEYYHLKSQVERAARKMREIVTQPINVLPFLNPGRLVKVSDPAAKTDWGWGVIVNFQKKNLKKDVSVDGAASTYIVDVLLECHPDSVKPGRKNMNKPRPPEAGNTGEWQVIPILLSLVEYLSSVRLYVPQDLKPKEARTKTGHMVREAGKRFPDGLPRLDPVEDMKINDENFIKIVRKIETLEDKLMQHKWHKAEDLKTEYALFEQRLALETQANQLRTDIKNASTDVVLRQQLKYMKRVLRRLGHVSEDNVVTMKGRVACEISTCDELLGTELIFGGVFNELTPEQSVALASCLVFDEKSDETPKVKDELAAPLRALQDAATRVAKVVQDARLPIDVDEYVKKFGSNMMDLVFAWCRGAKFSELCKMTDIFEGTIIRVMRRLEELLRQFAMASKQIGNAELEAKFNEGINKLKRDIVFAASLYL